jgi:hypothetical protein
MFPSVIVGDKAGIVKFCAAREAAAVRNAVLHLVSGLFGTEEILPLLAPLSRTCCAAARAVNLQAAAKEAIESQLTIATSRWSWVVAVAMMEG